MIKCQECGEEMIIDRSKVFTSLPPMYICKCPKCKNTQYEYCSLCDSGDSLKKYIKEVMEEQPLW